MPVGTSGIPVGIPLVPTGIPDGTDGILGSASACENCCACSQIICCLACCVAALQQCLLRAAPLSADLAKGGWLSTSPNAFVLLLWFHLHGAKHLYKWITVYNHMTPPPPPKQLALPCHTPWQRLQSKGPPCCGKQNTSSTLGCTSVGMLGVVSAVHGWPLQ